MSRTGSMEQLVWQMKLTRKMMVVFIYPSRLCRMTYGSCRHYLDYMARCQTGNVSPIDLHQPTPFFPKYLTSHPLNTPQRRFSPGPRTLHPSWPGLSLGWGSGNVGVFMWGSVGVSGSPAASSIATCQPTDRYLCS
ncbi:unnamed protein product [Boreogadus saida]